MARKLKIHDNKKLHIYALMLDNNTINIDSRHEKGVPL